MWSGRVTALCSIDETTTRSPRFSSPLSIRLQPSVQPERKSRSCESATPSRSAHWRRASNTTRAADSAIAYAPRPGFAPLSRMAETIASMTSGGFGHDVAP